MIFSVDSPDWVIMRKSGDAMQMELLKNELQNNEINCFLVNKKDTMYPLFGAYMLYVEKKYADIAKALIDNFIESNDAETE
ncbi:hypothetical protein [Jiulongibacter sp. NS-SX5]|uniref:hypothetical protein n=1 Tax=Jiulongibacter sp. NS-SX5 TaxID=3463854 RepID=UPI0040588429